MFSGSYIYFYPADQLQAIEEISKFYKNTQIIIPESASKVGERTKYN